MNTIRLANRLARRTKWKKLHDVPVGELDELVMCMNQAADEWYRAVPHIQKSGLLTETLKAPADVEISILDGAKSFAVSGSAPVWLVGDMTQAIGCTVIVGDDPKWNVLIGESQLALPYSGAGGTQSMRVLFNALPLGEHQRMITGPIFVLRPTDNMRYQLRPMPEDQIVLRWKGNETGTFPEAYAIRPIETWEAGDPRFVVRVFPAPAQDTIIETNVEQRPLVFTLADLRPPGRTIPLPEIDVDNVMLPIAAAKMLPAGLLDLTRFDARAVLAEAEAATVRARNADPSVDSAYNFVGTPEGF